MPLKMPCCSRFIKNWRAFMTHRTNSTLSVCRNTRNGLFCAFIWFDSIQMLTDTIRAHMHRNKMPNQNGNQFSRRNYDYNQNNSMERQKNVRKTRKRIRQKKNNNLLRRVITIANAYVVCWIIWNVLLNFAHSWQCARPNEDQCNEMTIVSGALNNRAARATEPEQYV